ncbi:DUF4440 domain-containing protein [Phytoactinopolyspora endophytica]|uniref:DUF4440 domain-containing protein n=1 Tax=Phytoactinopolyspora endophytica TaxID=1642495 RepID=UPI0013EBCC71|nr:DUF4440 domain-containing protein [Phytoactinopolyspora endophytica]
MRDHDDHDHDGGVRTGAHVRSDLTASHDAATRDSNSDTVAARGEIIRLHRIIERWLSGRASLDGDEFGGFRDVLAPAFTMVDPDGALVDRERVLEAVQAAHGTEPTIEIRIHDIALVAADAETVVATYREEHRGATSGRSQRQATATFIREHRAPHGLRWRHLHETWV